MAKQRARALPHGSVSVCLVLLLSSFATGEALSPDFDDEFLWNNHRNRAKEDAATLDTWRANAFRPFDATTSPPIDYGGRHPWDRGGRDLQQDYFVAKETFPINEQDYRNEGGTPAVHRPIRLHFDTRRLEAERGKSAKIDSQIDLIINTVLPAAAEVWSNALRVIPVVGSITVPRGACWGAVAIDEGFEVSDADVVIVVYSDRELCALVTNAVASASPCFTDQFDRPIMGAINFCLAETPVDEEEKAKLVGTATHELGHIFGFMSELIKYFRDGETGRPLTPRPFTSEKVTCMNGEIRNIVKASVMAEGVLSSGARYFELTTPRVTTVVRNQFDCQNLTGLRFESQPTNEASCLGSHIDERLFFTELMSAVYTKSMVLSALTLAVLEDSGWYKADYTRASISPFGHRAGCSFVNGDCIVDGEVPDYGKDFFCNAPLKLNADGIPVGTSEVLCDPSRRWKAACDLVDRSLVNDQFLAGGDAELPTEFQYFPENPYLGAAGMPLADFCPIPTLDFQDCRDSGFEGRFETFGPDSYCYNVFDAYFFDGSEFVSFQPLCLETRCNAEERVIEVIKDSDVVKCERDGQLQFVPGTGFQFACPRFAVICAELICPANCSGRGTCNNDNVCVCFDEKDKTPGCFGIDASEDGSPNVPTESPAGVTQEPTISPTKQTASPTPSPTEMPTEVTTEVTIGSTEEITTEIVTTAPTANDPSTPVPTVVEIIKLGGNSAVGLCDPLRKLRAVATAFLLSTLLVFCYI